MDILIIFGSISAVIIYITSRRYNERMERIRNGLYPDTREPQKTPRQGTKSLFFGLLAISIGIALLSSALIQVCGPDRHMISGSLYLLFSGASMLLYWKLTLPKRISD